MQLTHRLRNIPQEVDADAFMEIHSSLKLDATYFNQITQVFEPFIEPWQLDLNIVQKEEHAVFSLKLTGVEQLICNLTYGMALSLRNIYVEALE